MLQAMEILTLELPGVRKIASGKVREIFDLGEHRHAFSVDLVRSGPAAAQIVVVHARQVVVNERVGVDALDGARERQRSNCFSATTFRGGQT